MTIPEPPDVRVDHEQGALYLQLWHSAGAEIETTFCETVDGTVAVAVDVERDSARITGLEVFHLETVAAWLLAPDAAAARQLRGSQVGYDWERDAADFWLTDEPRGQAVEHRVECDDLNVDLVFLVEPGRGLVGIRLGRASDALPRDALMSWDGSK